MHRRLDLALVTLAMSLWLWVSWPSAHGSRPPVPTAPVTPPAAHCGAYLHIEAALPAPRGRNAPERLWIRNLEPVPIPLDGFELTNGRHKRSVAKALERAATLTDADAARSVDPTGDPTIAPGALLELSPPRLRNTDGRVMLLDPCGLTLSQMSWDDAPKDAVLFSDPARWRDHGASVMVPSLSRDLASVDHDQ